MSIHDLENPIDDFFTHETYVKRHQCDEFVLSRVRGPVNPVQLQGSCSYTVTAGTEEPRIFQFRGQNYDIDMETLYLAKRIHPQLVARCIYHGTIDKPRDPGPGHVHIYEMDKLPGTAYIMARDISANQPSEAKFRQLKTATDFAEFFAQSWRNNQYSDPNEAAKLLSGVKSTLRLLLRSRFPRQYLPNLLKVLEKLPSLFSGALPFVLSHQDLNEMNMLIDPETGSITGIVDWAEASIFPFGFSLWGFENILGYMDSEGWHYFDNRRELEDAFWQTFWAKASNITESKKKLIRVARMAGLFYRYGFIWNGKTIDREVEASDASSIAYLDAFCMTDDW